MTLLTFNLDAGPENQAVTTVNSGASVVSSSTSTVYRGASAVAGDYGVRLINAANAEATIRFAAANTSNQMSYSFFTSGPQSGVINGASKIAIAQFRHNSGVVASIYWTSTNDIEFASNTGTTIGTLLGSATKATVYRISAVINNLTGDYSVKIYTGTDSSFLSELEGTYAFPVTTQQSHLQLGSSTATTSVFQIDIDHVQISDNSNQEVIPVIGPATGINVATSNGTIVRATGTAGFGGTLSYDISQTSGPATSPELVAAGTWFIPVHQTQARMFAITATESPSATTAVQAVTVEPQSVPAASHGEEVIWDGSNWQ